MKLRTKHLLNGYFNWYPTVATFTWCLQTINVLITWRNPAGNEVIVDGNPNPGWMKNFDVNDLKTSVRYFTNTNLMHARSVSI